MWKLLILTFLCLFLTTLCDEDTSGDAKTTQIAAAAAAVGSSSGGNSGLSAAAAAQITSVKTQESRDSSSGPVKGSKSTGGSYGGNSDEEDDNDNDCNVEERDDDYDCTSAWPRVVEAIIKICFMRNNYFLKSNYANTSNYCDINQTQRKEGYVGSPIATWYTLAMLSLYTEDETLNDLLEFLGLENKDECRCMMKRIRRLIKPFLKDFYYYSANIMADYKQNFDELLKRDVIEYLDGKAVNSNFNKSQISARKENKIAAAKTGNVIQNVVSKEEASTVFNSDQIIVNIIGTYIKPVLKMSFNTEKKSIGIYYGLNEPTVTEYLYQEVIFNSTKSITLNARLINIPLKNKNTEFLIILPNTRCGLQSLVAKLASQPQIWEDEMNRLQPTCMHFTTPVYKSTTTTVENLVPALRSTCEIDRIFDVSKSQIIDSCGRPLNRSITYIHEKSTATFSPIGVEPYKPASASDCSACGEVVDVCINYPAVLLYLVKGIVVESVIGAVEILE